MFNRPILRLVCPLGMIDEKEREEFEALTPEQVNLKADVNRQGKTVYGRKTVV